MTVLSWSRQDRAKLARMWETHSIKDIALAIGRSPSAVKKAAWRWGLPAKPVCASVHVPDLSSWTPERDERLRAIYNEYPINDLALIFSVSSNVVRERAKKLKLSRKWIANRVKPEPLGELEIAPGHLAVDRRSYELLTGVGR